MTPFCAYMSKYILWVRIAICVIAKSDCLPNFVIERIEPHLKPGIWILIVPTRYIVIFVDEKTKSGTDIELGMGNFNNIIL